MKNGKIHPGKLKPAPKKVSRVRFYKFSIFGVSKMAKKHKFSIFGKLKTFFLRDDTHFQEFSHIPNTSKSDLSKKATKKSDFPHMVQFFFWLGMVEISLIKWQNMAILRLSWRGSTNNKKYIMQLICVKKDCFYPIQVMGMQFLYFWCISQRSKVWWKFPNKTWFFRSGSVFNCSWGVPDATKTWFLQVI